jgi:endonuclease YncB( thermonuclease family)
VVFCQDLWFTDGRAHQSVVAAPILKLFIITTAFYLAIPPMAHADIAGVASVIDGDTLEIHGQRIRLFGIDTPESRQTCEDAASREWRCGQKAALALQDLIGRRTVTCRKRDTDRYGRMVGAMHRGRDRHQRVAGQARAGPGIPQIFQGIRLG